MTASSTGRLNGRDNQIANVLSACSWAVVKNWPLRELHPPATTAPARTAVPTKFRRLIPFLVKQWCAAQYMIASKGTPQAVSSLGLLHQCLVVVIRRHPRSFFKTLSPPERPRCKSQHDLNQHPKPTNWASKMEASAEERAAPKRVVRHAPYRLLTTGAKRDSPPDRRGIIHN